MEIAKLAGQTVISFNILTLVVFLLLFGIVFFAIGYMVENRHWINLIHGKEEKVSERKAMMPLSNKRGNPQSGRGISDPRKEN